MEDKKSAEKLDIDEESAGMRIDSWLAVKMPCYSRSYFKKILDGGMVLVNGNPAKANLRLKAGDSAEVVFPEEAAGDIKAEDISLAIIYEDEDLIIVNKPKGMVVHPACGNRTGTLVNALMGRFESNLSDEGGSDRPGIVHRIDKDTSGLLVVAKNNRAHEKLSNMLKSHDIKRVYSAVVSGVIREDSGTVDAPVGRHPNDRRKMSILIDGGKRAVTHFRVLKRFDDATQLEINLETGRTHQIRVHMAYIGHPVLGDEVYGKKFRMPQNASGCPREELKGQALHARKLIFEHPSSKRVMEFDCGFPEYFKDLLDYLNEK